MKTQETKNSQKPFEKQENHDKPISSFTKKTLKQSNNLIQIMVAMDEINVGVIE